RRSCRSRDDSHDPTIDVGEQELNHRGTETQRRESVSLPDSSSVSLCLCGSSQASTELLMDRSNPYEAAFEKYLTDRGLCYVGVDEKKRSVLGEVPVKNLDFIVLGASG